MAFGAMVGYGWDTTLHLLACYVGMNPKIPISIGTLDLSSTVYLKCNDSFASFISSRLEKKRCLGQIRPPMPSVLYNLPQRIHQRDPF
jgi:hypothetical protein